MKRCPRCGYSPNSPRSRQKEKAVRFLLKHKHLWLNGASEEMEHSLARMLKAEKIYSARTFIKDIKVKKLIERAKDFDSGASTSEVAVSRSVSPQG